LKEIYGFPFFVSIEQSFFVIISVLYGCFNANIAPLTPYAIRGAIYYQGEMNAGQHREYRYGLQALIESWRGAWDNPELPFLIVQLPGFIKHEQKKHALDMDDKILAEFKGENINHGFCQVREAQWQVCRTVPHTALAITIDLGEPFDIHPPRKKPVAERLFLQARRLVYGEKDLTATGPVPSRVEKKDKSLIVHFDHAGGGLAAANGKLAGFELSGDGETFVPAVARISGITVIVTADAVPDPRSVRYAWAGYPEVTLYNREGLPATPFRWPEPDETEQ